MRQHQKEQTIMADTTIQSQTPATDNPILKKFDADLHAVTTKFRKDHQGAFWFSIASSNVAKRGKNLPARKPAPADAMLAEYITALDAVVDRYTAQHAAWVFSYKGAKVEALLKAGSISHNTRPLGAADKLVPPPQE
jgi:hypothetical protein